MITDEAVQEVGCIYITYYIILYLSYKHNTESEKLYIPA